MRPWKHLAAKHPEDLDPWVRANLDHFAEREDTALNALSGDHLAHTDLHELNLLVGRQRSHIIDWAWARRAAPWVDAEMLTVRLVAAGHSCESADQVRLERFPYPETETAIRRLFAIEMLGVWLRLFMRWPSREPLIEMSTHALPWARYLEES